MPSLSSVRETPKPGVPFSTTKALMPRWPRARSVWAKTSAKADSRPLVMNSLRPVTT
jgi:hypothetical protein